MFFQLLYIHLYRPFLKYTRATSPLPSHISPRKFCTQAAGAISKLFRLYKRTHGLRQICNIAVYIIHSACTIHLLNLPDKTAKRDIIHGVKHLEEIGECWTCARRTLRILNLCADKWNIEVPDEAAASFARSRARWGSPSPAGSPAFNHLFAAQAQMSSQQSRGPIPQSVQPVQQQQQAQQRPEISNTTIAQLQNGYAAELYTSPASTVDTRRSSGGLSLPPQRAADFNRNNFRVKPATQLTKAQQEAWNRHEAARRRASIAANSRASAGSADLTTDAARLFGGVDSLIEDNQDWWFKDQNSLALGFENWTDMDWTTFGNDLQNAVAGGGGQSLGSGGGAQSTQTQQYSFPDIADYGNSARTGYYGLSSASDFQKPLKREDSAAKEGLRQHQPPQRLPQQGKRPLMHFDENMFY